MDLMELEEITATVGGIADLLGALCCLEEENGTAFKGLETLRLLAVNAYNGLDKFTNAAFSKAKKAEKKGANVA